MDKMLYDLLHNYLEENDMRKYWSQDSYHAVSRRLTALEDQIRATMGKQFSEQLCQAEIDHADVLQGFYFEEGFRYGARLALAMTAPF